MKITKGFSLLELTLVLGVGSLMAFIKFQDMRNEQETVMANAVGSQIKQIGEAVNRYISVRYDKLSTLSNAAGNGSDPGPRTCSDSSCEITYRTLINEGFLPASYTGENINKTGYRIILRRDGTAPNYVINGLVITSDAWKDGSKFRYDLLGKAMWAAGIDSGMTKTPTEASGYGGQWSEKSSDYKSIISEGLLAYRVGYNSSMYSVYLRRDGTLPMTGNLNMGGQDINNTKNITATGTTTSGILRSTGDTNVGGRLTVAATGSFGGNIGVKGISPEAQPAGYIGGVISPDYYAQAGMYIAKTGTAVSDANWAFAANREGNLKVSNDINAGRNIIAGNWLIAHNGGGNTMFIGGDNAPGANGTVGNDYEIRMDTAKVLTLWNTVTTNDRKQTVLDVWGTQHIAGNLNVDASKGSNGNISASGNLNGNRLTANEYVQINGVATIDAACSPNGLIGRDGSGEILYCKDGQWKKSTGTGRQCNANGCYMTLFDGTVLQWGQTWNNQGGNSYITFPIAFPNACSNVSLTALNTSLSGNAKNVPYVNISSINNSSVWISNGQSSAYGTMWYAIGY